MKKIWKVWTVILVVAATVLLTISTQYSKKEEISTDSYQYLIGVNSDIRKIFGLGEKEKAKASRLLTSAVDGGYIKVMDPDTAPRYKKYIPYWA